MPASEDFTSMQRSVVITGCSVGAGHAAALLMAREGWQVFAAVRKPADAERLEKAAPGSLRALLCDVRERDQVFAMARAVEQALGDGGLDGLVCNAGVGAGGPIEFLDHQEMTTPIEVNLYGSLYCAQAFLPLLRRARGRIINVSSGSVLLDMPLMSTYPASKIALELISRQLQAEVERFGIHVCVLDPGHVRSRMTQSAPESNAAAQAKLPPAARELYGDLLDRITQLSRDMEGSGKEPEEVAKVYLRALTEPRPKAFYTAGADAKWLRWVAKSLPQWARTRLANRIMTG
ncbi:MAG: SDR family NAD(P)-dependent oxidoreductase [Deltaproteobacteria bacterium]|nr:SDR family NAD(P)-dependent oxidoreductase [Deltaproteobacteria bacterium]